MISRLSVVLAGLLAAPLGIVALSSAGDGDVVLSGPAPVRIWKSQAAMEQAQDLLAAAPPDEALTSLLACEVAPGTRASVTRAERSYAWDAEITEGPRRGCRGVIGPRDFTTDAELARPRAKAPAEALASATRPRASPAPAGQPDSQMILWYQLYEVAYDGRTRTSWSPVVGWDTPSQCDEARRRLLDADAQEASAIARRAEALTRATSGRITISHIPREYGLDLEVRTFTGGAWRVGHLEVRSYCFPVDHDPRR